MSTHTIYSTLPDGLDITSNSYGRCLVATQTFPAGATIYHESIPLVAVSALPETTWLVIQNRPGLEPIALDHRTHHVLIGDRKQTYGFESFTNHSCDPNTRPVHWQVFEDPDRIEFDTIAVKEIHAGDEICCDYALFDYACHGHEIAACLCGAQQCRGRCLGFKGLTDEQKLQVMPLALPLVVQHYVEEEKLTRLSVASPSTERVELITDCRDSSSSVHAYLKTRAAVREGDEICELSSPLLSDETALRRNTSKVLVSVGEKVYLFLDNKKHLIRGAEGRERLFVWHSLLRDAEENDISANCAVVESEGAAFKLIATKNLQAGDRLYL